MFNDPRFTTEIGLVIPFHGVNITDVAWHGSCFRYFEVAREVLFNQFGYGYRQMKEPGYLQPVVDTRVKYCHILTFEQRIRMRAHVRKLENRLRIDYQIFGAETSKRATTGHTIQVAVEE